MASITIPRVCRLNSASLYIANTKVSGFQMEVTNNDPNQVIVGVRVCLGCQDVGRIPSYIEMFGRTLSIAGNPTPVTRSRWFEFPLTREESLQGGTDKKITITFGQSLDPGGVNIVDCVQVFGKTKVTKWTLYHFNIIFDTLRNIVIQESFGWPDDHDSELCSGLGTGSSSALGQGGSSPYGDVSAGEQMPLTDVGRMVTGLLDVLDGCFNILEVAPPPRPSTPPESGVMKSVGETHEDRKAKVRKNILDLHS